MSAPTLNGNAIQSAIEADLQKPRERVENRTSLTYWFPKIEAAGLPVPKTIIIELPEDARSAIWNVFDGKPMGDAPNSFFGKIKAAGESLGYPCFLRTSHTSGKHDWERTCFLNGPHQVKKHVAAIIEYGEMASIFGLPHDWWAVRELLPTKPLTVCSRFGNMPVCKEFRVFVRDSKVECWHPYWPLHALEQGGAIAPEISFKDLNACQDEEGLLALAAKAGAACGGYWSVDLLDTERGWYITDMAEGEKSFHWEICANAPRSGPC